MEEVVITRWAYNRGMRSLVAAILLMSAIPLAATASDFDSLSVEEIRALPGFVASEDAQWFTSSSSARESAEVDAPRVFRCIGYLETRNETGKVLTLVFADNGDHVSFSPWCDEVVPAWVEPALDHLVDYGMLACMCMMGEFSWEPARAGFDQYATLRKLGLYCQAVEVQLEQ